MKLIALFFYMVLPLIWLVITALVDGYDVRDDKSCCACTTGSNASASATRRFQSSGAIPSSISSGLSLPLPADRQWRPADAEFGVVLMRHIIVGYRLIDWAGGVGCGWRRPAIRPHDLDSGKCCPNVTLLFGSPSMISYRHPGRAPPHLLPRGDPRTAFALPKRAQAAMQLGRSDQARRPFEAQIIGPLAADADGRPQRAASASFGTRNASRIFSVSPALAPEKAAEMQAFRSPEDGSTLT